MITPKKCFYQFSLKIKIDAKISGVLGQDLSVYMTLSIGRVFLVQNVLDHHQLEVFRFVLELFR